MLIACTPPRRLIGWAFCQPVALRDVFKAVRRLDSGAVYQVMALRLDYVHATLRDESGALCGVSESIQATKEHERGKKRSRGASVCKALEKQVRPLYFWHYACSC